MRFAAGPLAVVITASDDALARAAAANFQCPPAADDAELLEVVCRRLDDGRITLTSRGGDMTVQDAAELSNAVHALVQDAVARTCRARTAFHAAACVAPNGRALLVAGLSGAGKSSSALGLALRGWRCLTDDLAFVDLATGEVNGCDPTIRLDEPAPAGLGEFPPGWEHDRREDVGIEGDPIVHHHYRPPRPATPGPWSVPVGGVVLPLRGGGDEPRLLTAGAALERLWPQRLAVRHTREPAGPGELGRALAHVPVAEISSSSVEQIGPNLVTWWHAVACRDSA